MPPSKVTFVHDGVELNELTVVTFPVVEDACHFLADDLRLMTSGTSVVIVKISGRCSWMNIEDLYGNVEMIKLPGHGACHRVLSGFAGHVSHRVPVRAEGGRHCDVADPAVVLLQKWQQ